MKRQAQKATSAYRACWRKKYKRESVTRTSRISITILFFHLFRRSSSSESPQSSRTRFAWSRRSGNGRRKKRRRGESNSGKKLRSLANNCEAKITGERKLLTRSLERKNKLSKLLRFISDAWNRWSDIRRQHATL